MTEHKLPGFFEPAAKPMNERKKQSTLERLWLTYFNDTLFAQGIITEVEHNKMRVRINNRAVSAER
jgi:hypothetical protein